MADHTNRLSYWSHAFVWSIVALVSLLGLSASYKFQGKDIWSTWTESHELRRSAYAERVIATDLFRTRANTWSNLAYVIVGLYAIAYGARDCRSHARPQGYLTKTPSLSFAFGIACCYLGFASGFFHASLTRFGQQLDVASMYAPLMVLIAIHIGRWIPDLRVGNRSRVLPTWWALLAGVVILEVWLFAYKWSMSSMTVLTTLITILIAFMLLDHFLKVRDLNAHWLIGSCWFLILAIACRQLDIASRFSGPDAWLQGHAIWHVLTSLCLLCMYKHARN